MSQFKHYGHQRLLDRNVYEDKISFSIVPKHRTAKGSEKDYLRTTTALNGEES